MSRLRDCVDRVHHGYTMNRARCTAGAHRRGAGTVLYLADARQWQLKGGGGDTEPAWDLTREWKVA
jgi:hypothetical protein